jgi:GT2 family glycosyltransferase
MEGKGQGNNKGRAKADIIVCVVNLLDYTKDAFASLYKNETIPFNLIVVDICSTDGTQQWLKEFAETHDNVKIHLKTEKDKGFAEGFNTGLKYCETPYVASYHSDMLVKSSGWLKHILPIFEKKQQVAYIGSKLLYLNDTIQHGGCSFHPDLLYWYHIGRNKNGLYFSQTRELPGVTGAGSVTRKEAIPDGLPTFYERAEYSDVELSCQLRSDGWKIFYCGKAVLYHAESLSKKNWDWNALQERYSNHFRTFKQRWEMWLREDIETHPELYYELESNFR